MSQALLPDDEILCEETAVAQFLSSILEGKLLALPGCPTWASVVVLLLKIELRVQGQSQNKKNQSFLNDCMDYASYPPKPHPALTEREINTGSSKATALLLQVHLVLINPASS